MTTSPTACSEPDGQEHPLEGDPRTAHDIMIDESGACPWCGEEEDR